MRTCSVMGVYLTELNLGAHVAVAVHKVGQRGFNNSFARKGKKFTRTLEFPIPEEEEDPLTSGIAWKIDEEEGHVFPRLSIKVREEVVTLELGEEDFNPVDLTATHLKPSEWREAMKEDNVVILDARNDYEWEIGRFEGAILPEVPSFKDLPG